MLYTSTVGRSPLSPSRTPWLRYSFTRELNDSQRARFIRARHAHRHLHHGSDCLNPAGHLELL